jgi:hypothetical protein
VDAAQSLGIEPEQERVCVNDEPGKRERLESESLTSPARSEGEELGLFDAVFVEVLAVADLRVQFAVAKVATILVSFCETSRAVDLLVGGV